MKHAAPPSIPQLRARLKAWRAGEIDGHPKRNLHEAAALLGLSTGYISGLENHDAITITVKVYRKYHAVAPDVFPKSDGFLLI